MGNITTNEAFAASNVLKQYCIDHCLSDSCKLCPFAMPGNDCEFHCIDIPGVWVERPVVFHTVDNGVIDHKNLSPLPYYDEKLEQFVVFTEGDEYRQVICYVDQYDVAIDLIIALEEYYKNVVPSGATF